MKTISILVLVPLVTVLNVMAQTVIDVSKYGAIPNDGGAKGSVRAGDDTQGFKDAIAAAKIVSGHVHLKIPPGTYDFYPDDATQRACFTSNSTEETSNGVKTIAIDLIDIDDLTILGEGVTFMMRGKMTMFVAERCENLSLLGATFDFKRPTMSELTVTEKGEDYWIGKIHPDSDYTITENKIRWDGEGWSVYHNLVQPYDHATKITWRSRDPTSGARSIQDLGNHRVKFNVTGNALRSAVVGRTYQFRNGKRDAVGMWFNRCKNVVLKDVKVRAMHGFGILGQYTENMTIERLVVAPDPTSGRTNASSADVTHFSGCRGLIRIVDSVLSSAHDDALNVHGTHLRVVAKPTENQVRVRFMHRQTRGFQAFFPGDKVSFTSLKTLLPLGEAKVKSVVVESESEQLLTLDRDIPTTVSVGKDAVENITWTPSLELINCDIKQIPTRGILLTTPRRVLIQGNRFYNTRMPAILIEKDADGWFESGRITNLTVKDNVFYECGGKETVKVNPKNSTHAGAVHRNILFEGNEFVMSNHVAFNLKSTDHVTIRKNTFRMQNGGTPTEDDLIQKKNAGNIKFIDNSIIPVSESTQKP